MVNESFLTDGCLGWLYVILNQSPMTIPMISRNISSDIYENYNNLASQAKNLRFWCAIESGKKNLPVNIPTVYLILNTKSYENNSSYPQNFRLRRAYFLTFSTQNPYFLKSTHFPLKSLESTHLLNPPSPIGGVYKLLNKKFPLRFPGSEPLFTKMTLT